jgi:hypothetical protein
MKSINIRLFIGLILIVTSCSLLNKYEKDRILLDFYLGMTFKQFDEHISKLEEREDIDVWRTEPETEVYTIQNDFYFRYRLIDNITATLYFTPNLDFIEFGSFDGEDDRITSILLRIEEYNFDYMRPINNSDKKIVINTFLEKYGQDYTYKNQELIWSLPSKAETRYYCKLDTSNMILQYHYNPEFIEPILEAEENSNKSKEKSKLKESI